MSSAYLGQIALFPYTFTNLRNWHVCDGSLIPITQNTALYSLLGTAYGGNGSSTFGLPDLRGRVAIGAGAGAGRSAYTPGQVGGAEQATLNANNLAPHTHTGALQVVGPGRGVTTENPATGDYLYTETTVASSSSPTLVSLGGVPIGTTGGGAPFSVLPPYQAMYYFICVAGIYPSRS